MANNFNAKNYKPNPDLNIFEGEVRMAHSGIITSDGVQANHIPDAIVSADTIPTKSEFDALVSATNAILVALENLGILKNS